MNIDEEMKKALRTFTIESMELLQEMEEGLLNIENEDDSSEKINAIFRAAHTIKGSSGLFGLDHIVRFTHVVESLLDAIRDGSVPVSGDLVAALLPCCDHITLLINAISEGNIEEDPSLTESGNILLAKLKPYLEGNKGSSLVVTIPQKADKIEAIAPKNASGNWHLSLRFGPDSLRNGMDPLAFIRYLITLGEIVHMTTITNGIPDAEVMDAETNYLGFELDLKSEATKETIESVFDFVREDSLIHILPIESSIDKFVDLIRLLPEDDAYLGQLLVKSGVITERELQDGLSKQKIDSEVNSQTQPIGEILIEQQAVQEPVVNAALEKQKQIKDNKARENQSIRVDAERLDKLIDLIGELVIAGAGVNLRALQTGEAALLETTGEMMRLVEEVRDSALQLRMVPVGATFSRFQRVVRDVSKELGKDISLVITGGDTEMDKSVVEKISDPLMHLVRNAMDHGIEAEELRRQRGKPSQGTLKLNAYHESGSIVIEVIDDGGGLNRERILAKAIEKGMVQPETKLSDQEVYALIFEPGFSTAQQVSNLSGRGVGMDVVKRNVTDLRGTIEVESSLGVGTTLRIRLPLTLAIIDGFLVGIGKSSFVIPLDRVVECVEFPSGLDNRDYMDLRGEVLPFIRLAEVFDIDDEGSKRANVVIVEVSGAKTGLVVDRLLGEHQTVIKPLGKLFAHIKGVAGSTILGNGKVALILDVPNLVGFVEKHNNAFLQNINYHPV